MSTLSEVMTTKVLTLTAEHSLADARHLMVDNQIRHIPIVNSQNELIGLISQRDVLAAEESSVKAIEQEQRLAREKAILIKDFYKTELATISPHVALHQAALFMQKHKIGCLPVTEGNKLLGVITESDFVNIAINLMEMMNASEPI